MVDARRLAVGRAETSWTAQWFTIVIYAATYAATVLAGNETALVAHCSRFHDFEAGIAEDLLPWHDGAGITEALMDRTIAERSMENRVPGLPLCIRNGRLYVIHGKDQNITNVWEWQADNIIVYAHAMQRLVSRWGAALPDVEFLIETQDYPYQDLGVGSAVAEAETAAAAAGAAGDAGGAAAGVAAGSGPEVEASWGVWAEPHERLPVMRHCKAATSVDIAVPIFHFYSMHYDSHSLANIERLNAELPWEARQPAAFAAGTTYHRHQAIPATTKHWDGERQGQKVEMVRASFSDFLTRELRHPNISYSDGQLPLAEWAKYRMLLHVDGITCSSRVWQLLALGSVVLREQSGYFAFYDKLLMKFVHYVPFWSHRPREVVWAYNWVVENEELARSIAARGQAFAAARLNRDAIECFWALLLRRYARLLRFTPGRRGGGGAAGAGEAVGGEGLELEMMPMEEWLKSQEGRIASWGPSRVVDREADLNLLPNTPMT